MNNKKFKFLDDFLPSNYAKILYKKYSRTEKPYSKSLIYKVASGERENQIIMEDLILLAERRKEYLNKLNKIEKRNENSKQNIYRRKNNRRTLFDLLPKIFGSRRNA